MQLRAFRRDLSPAPGRRASIARRPTRSLLCSGDSQGGHITQFAEIDGARIAFDIAGDGPGIVLIHAGVTASGMWDEVMPQLATDRRVVRFDMRGFGESIEDEQLEWRADRDVIAVMDAAGLDQAVIVGVSMGGGAAIDTALEHPERVSGVIAVNPGISGFRADDGEWAVERFKQMKPAWDAGDKEEVARLEMEIWLAGPHRRLEEMPQDMITTMQDWLLVAYEKEPWDRQQGLKPPAADRLGEIRVPVLGVLGELDLPSLAATIDHIAEGAAQGSKVVMPGVAHLAPWEQPDEFVAIVREFL